MTIITTKACFIAVLIAIAVSYSLGVFIGFSGTKKRSKKAGDLVIKNENDRDVYSLQLDVDFEELEGLSNVYFKVVNRTAEERKLYSDKYGLG